MGKKQIADLWISQQSRNLLVFISYYLEVLFSVEKHKLVFV